MSLGLSQSLSKFSGFGCSQNSLTDASLGPMSLKITYAVECIQYKLTLDA